MIDFDSALDVHVLRKRRFRESMSDGATLDVARIGRANGCALGEWLYGESDIDLVATPAFNACITAHALFHRQAARVAEAINGGDHAAAEALMAETGAYHDASTHVVGAIIALRRAIAVLDEQRLRDAPPRVENAA